jgi:hypothetical protein
VRQFAIDGPREREKKSGEITSVYQFDGGASPANTPRKTLPVLPMEAFHLACDLFDGIAAATGLVAVKSTRVAAEHEGNSFRVTSSFLGHGSNPTKCIVGNSQRHGCICVHDFETGLTHMPARRDPATLFEFLGQLQTRNPFR